VVRTNISSSTGTAGPGKKAGSRPISSPPDKRAQQLPRFDVVRIGATGAVLAASAIVVLAEENSALEATAAGQRSPGVLASRTFRNERGQRTVGGHNQGGAGIQRQHRTVDLQMVQGRIVDIGTVESAHVLRAGAINFG
jgi:hypothetical protein